ncbi:MAG: AsmA-like C-terminal region-containing protein [Desulfotignum sp.]|nr:AsmA-like C-terminal region-containing protein [Desulfotignum sp.]
MVVRRIVLYTAAALTALVLISPFILEQIINTRYVKTRMAQFIEKQTGAVLGPDQMAFQLSPLPGIRLQNLALPLSRTMGLHVNAIDVDLDFTELLQGNIVVSRVLLEDLNFWFNPDMDPVSFNFHDFFVSGFPKDQMNTLFAMFPENQKDFELVLKNCQTQYFTSLNGTLWISKTRQIMQLDTLIQNVQINKKALFLSLPYENFPVDRFDSALARVHVRLDAETGITGTVRLDQFQVLSDRLPDNTVCGNMLNINFLSSPQHFSFNLEPAYLDSPAAEVSMSFTDDRKTQKTALTFSGNDIDLAQARDASLAWIPENRVVQHLFDIIRDGKASDLSVKFQSASVDTLFNPGQMVLEGTAGSALVKIPETGLMAMDVDGKARVLNGVLDINAHKGRVGNTRLHEGQLEIDLMNHKDVPFNGEFALDVDLSELPDVLISLLPDTSLAREMEKVHQVKGQVTARLGLGLQTGQKDLSVSVTTGPFSGSGYYDRIPLPISISQGIFHYETDQISLTGFSGRVGTNPVTDLNARVDLARDGFLTLSTRTIDLNIEEIWPKLKPLEKIQALMGPVEQVNGRLAIERFNFKGPMFHPAKWTWDLSGSGQNIQAGFSPDTREIKDLSAIFEISEKSFAARDLKAMVTSLKWLPVQMVSAHSDSIVLPLFAQEGKIEVEKGQISVSTDLVFASDTRLSVRLAGNTPEDLKPEIVMLRHKPFSDAMILFDWHPDTPLARFEGTLDTRTLDTMLVKNMPLQRLLTTLTRDLPVKIYTDNYSNLHVIARFIHLDTLISGLFGKDFPGTQPLLVHKDLQIKTDTLVYDNFSFSDLNAAVAWDQHKTDIKLLSADFCGLNLSGSLTLDRKQPEIDAVTKIDIQAKDRESITPLLACFFPDIRLVTGGYSFTTSLTGKGLLHSLQNSLNGSLFFSSHNGKIHKMTLLSRLLSVLNILKLPDITQEGFRYRSILVQAQVKNGVIHLEKAVIDAENMALIFTGKIHPFENHLNLTCLVAPLKTIDTIIQYIPIVNTILSGRLVSFPAKATGPIDDPVITPLHPSAVGEGLINLLTSLIKTPVRLFEGTP